MTDHPQIDRLRELGERATAGPWEAVSCDDYQIVASAYPTSYPHCFPGDDTGSCLAVFGNRPADFGEANRDLAVAAVNFVRNDLPALHAKIAELEGEQGLELDVNGEAMVCMGCGTTRSIGGIKARSTTAFSCCPERKMVPVRALLAERDAASARVGELEEALEPFANGDIDVSHTAVILRGDALVHLRRARLARGEG